MFMPDETELKGLYFSNQEFKRKEINIFMLEHMNNKWNYFIN